MHSVFIINTQHGQGKEREGGGVYTVRRESVEVFLRQQSLGFPAKTTLQHLACFDRLSATVCLYSIIPALAGGGGGGHQSHLPFSSSLFEV